MYYVYVLKSEVDSNTYIGYSSDLKARFESHNKGKNKSTKHRAPFKLIYYEAYKNETDARRREQELKNNNYKKEQLFMGISNSLL